MSATTRVLDDWARGALWWQFWWRFGLLDVTLRYRRTYLGPIWITLTFAMTAAGLAFVYSVLFGVDITTFIPYLVAGLAAWMFISGLITEGCTSLIRHAGLIREQNLPILGHAIRNVVSALAVFLHNFAVAVAAILIFGGRPSPVMLLAVVGIAVIALNGVWMSVFFGLLSARFRDLPPLVSTLVNLSFLITPVFWYRDMLRARAMIADINPFYHFIELVRAPLLGQVPAPLTIAYVAAVTAIGWALTLLVAARLQPRLAYWV